MFMAMQLSLMMLQDNTSKSQIKYMTHRYCPKDLGMKLKCSDVEKGLCIMF